MHFLVQFTMQIRFFANECTSYLRIQYLLHQRTEIPSNTRGELSFTFTQVLHILFTLFIYSFLS